MKRYKKTDMIRAVANPEREGANGFFSAGLPRSLHVNIFLLTKDKLEMARRIVRDVLPHVRG